MRFNTPLTIKSKTILTIVVCILFLCFAIPFLLCSGCEALRFAPTESQKQTAELTHTLAARVNVEGTEPQSPASEKLYEGTRAAASYMGRAKTPPDPEQFDTIAGQANTDAVQRPDPWVTADHILELGIGICALVGGVYGTKAVQYLKHAKEKSEALKEIIHGNELFKQRLASEHGDAAELFRQAQDGTQRSPTKVLVTELKS